MVVTMLVFLHALQLVPSVAVLFVMDNARLLAKVVQVLVGIIVVICVAVVIIHVKVLAIQLVAELV